jgi:hypothetical protein
MRYRGLLFYYPASQSMVAQSHLSFTDSQHKVHNFILSKLAAPLFQKAGLDSLFNQISKTLYLG